MNEQNDKNCDEKKKTIYDVASALGVSASTVSRAISGKGRVGEETKVKILNYMEENQFHLRSHKMEKNPRTRNVAIVVPEVKELMDIPFFYVCIFGVNEMAMARGYDMFVVTTSGQDISHLKRLVDNGKVDGMILSRTYTGDILASYLKQCGIPFVTIGTCDDDEIVQVNYDNEGACRDLTSILLARGMRRIAYLGTQDKYVVNDERLAGYIRAHKNAGIEIDWDIVYKGRRTPVIIQNKVSEFIEQKVDCILCQSDAVCNTVLTELRNKKIRIPEDMKVASCYNSEILNNYPISITTLHFDVAESGREACRLLLNLIEGKEAPMKTLLDYEVVMKDSTK